MAYESVYHVGPFVTRKIARSLGMIQYLSGVPCKIGHLTERWTANNCCIQCYRAARKPQVLNAAQIEYRAAWRRNNAELARLHRRLGYIRRKAKELASSKAWKARNKEKVRAYYRSYKARECNAAGDHTAAEILDIYRLQRGRCAYCRTALKEKYHVDHILPLARGGTNDRSNLQLTCVDCNLRKSDIDPLVFAHRRGLLL